MNGLARVVFGIAMVVGAITVAASMASIGMAENTENGLRALGDANLWTSEPKRVEPALQTYERLPPALSTYAVTNSEKVAVETPVAAAPILADGRRALTGVSPEHVKWCSSHYRSFDPTTNTYRSFQGHVRVCQPLSEKSGDTLASTSSAAPDPLANAAVSCANRYKSYRAEDNTYQPYGGPRIKCSPPAGTRTVAANE